MLVLTERIEHLALRDNHFPCARNDLLPNGAIRIVAIDQVEKIWRDRERELLVGVRTPGFLVRRERHQLLQLLDRGDAVLELPRPVLPIALGNVLPESLAFKPGGAIFSVRH